MNRLLLALAIITTPSLCSAQEWLCKMTHSVIVSQDSNGRSVETKQWSGVAVAPDLILSVAHSITNGEAKAEFEGGTVVATVIKFDKDRDLALFKATGTLKPIKIAKERPRLAKILGFAMGHKKVVSYPVSATIAYVIPTEHLLVMDGEAFHGMSGGPVLNENGELVGIQSSGDKAMTMASSPEQIKSFLNSRP